MNPRYRLIALAVAALIAAVAASHRLGPHITGAAPISPYVAFSLKRAEAQLRQDPRASVELRTLGGMTRLAGVVYDRRRQDLILVGQIVPGDRPITTDDLAVALRARMVARQWPLVSIDKTPTTLATGSQTVRFEGGVCDSSYGMDLLLADIALKKIGLGLLRCQLPSYVDLSAEDVRRGAHPRAISTRFWFVPVRAAIARREDVMAIQDLAIGIHAQVMTASSSGEPGGVPGDPAGERFAQMLTDGYSTLSADLPPVRRLKVLFDLAGLAEGIRTLPGRPDMSYWLEEYRLPAVATPRAQPLLQRSTVVSTSEGIRTMTIDGGIELRALVSNLRGGDVTALRELVLRSRPDPQALVWRVPLYGWTIPGAPSAETAPRAGVGENGSDDPGCYFTKTLVGGDAATIGNGGIRMPYTPLNAVGPAVRFSESLPAGRRGGVSFSNSLHSDGRGGDALRAIARSARPGSHTAAWSIELPEEIKR